MAYMVWLKFLNEESGAKRIGCTSRVMHLVSQLVEAVLTPAGYWSCSRQSHPTGQGPVPIRLTADTSQKSRVHMYFQLTSYEFRVLNNPFKFDNLQKKVLRTHGKCNPYNQFCFIKDTSQHQPNGSYAQGCLGGVQDYCPFPEGGLGLSASQHLMWPLTHLEALNTSHVGFSISLATGLSCLTLCPPQRGGEEFRPVINVCSAPPLKLSKDLPESPKEVWSQGFIMNDKGHSCHTGNSKGF